MFFFALESSQDDGEDEVRLEGSLNSMRCHESNDEVGQRLASAKLIEYATLFCYVPVYV